MAYGKLAERNELSAKSSGISLIKIISPLFIFQLLFQFYHLIILIIFYLLNLKSGTLIYDIQKKKPAINIRKVSFIMKLMDTQ